MASKGCGDALLTSGCPSYPSRHFHRESLYGGKMKKTTIWLPLGLAVMVALATLSCSGGKKEAEKKPPEHEKMVQQYEKGVEESKKVVIARVNGTEITMKDLIEQMNRMAPKYLSKREERSPETDQRVKKEALDFLVFRELATQEAARRGMKVKPEAVDQAIAAIKSKAGSEEAFRKNLAMTGYTEATMRQAVERGLLFDMIAGQEIFQKIKVDEKRIKAVYDRDRMKFNQPETFAVDEVVVMTGSDEAAVMKRAKELLSYLRKNNNDFSKLTPDSTFMVRQGMISRQEYPRLFAAAAKLKHGELSEVIGEDDGFHIIRVVGHEPGTKMTYEEAHGIIENDLKQPMLEKRKQEFEAQLKKNARVEITLDAAEKKLRELSAKSSAK